MMSKWLELSVQVDGEAAEAVSEVFNRYGQGGAVIERLYPSEGYASLELKVKTYLLPEQKESLRQIEEALWHLSQIYPIHPPSIRLLEEEDWTTAWRKHYQPVKIGQRLAIVPSWYESQPIEGELTITLDPGMAFGTGLHPTTRMCLVALEKYLRPGWHVLDMGTGSGILAIAAAKLGASYVLALDIDPVAVRAASENAALNGVASIIAVRQGSLEEVTGSFDLLLANILAETVAELVEKGLMEHLKPGGLWIASGIIKERENFLQDVLARHHLSVIERLEEGDWLTLVG